MNIIQLSTYIVEFVFFPHENASETRAECERGMALQHVGHLRVNIIIVARHSSTTCGFTAHVNKIESGEPHHWLPYFYEEG
jgi:hypothetical protein